MPVEILHSILTIIGSGFAAWIGVKTEIKWIVKTLDRHEDYHEKHFNDRGIKYVKIKR